MVTIVIPDNTITIATPSFIYFLFFAEFITEPESVISTISPINGVCLLFRKAYQSEEAASYS